MNKARQVRTAIFRALAAASVAAVVALSAIGGAALGIASAPPSSSVTTASVYLDGTAPLTQASSVYLDATPSAPQAFQAYSVYLD